MRENFPFLVYRSAEEDVSVNAVIKDESIWLTQKAMAELFEVDKSTISRHLKNIFQGGELQEKVVVAKIATTTPHGAMEGKTQIREAQFYNLDAIISVGYRVNSRRATHFRIWATGVLKEYMTKGFALDDERLKQGKTAFGTDYFKELLERVRSIRASERRMAADHRYLRRVQYRLRPSGAHHLGVLRHGTEQISLRHHWAYRGGDRLRGRGPHKTQHGADHMEERPGRAHPEVRCPNRQELFDRAADPSAGAWSGW